MSQPSVPTPATDHDLGLDLIKIGATFLVILTHVNMNGTGAFSPIWASSNVINAIARPCVPLFLMVTGALLLPRADDIRKLWERMWRIGFVLVAWSLLTYFYFTLRGNRIPFTYESIDRHAFPLWYLKMLLVAYLFLPLLQLMYRGSSRAVMGLVAGALCILFLVLPTRDEIVGSSISGFYNSYLGQFNFGYLFYLVAGALCATVPVSRRLTWIAALLLVASTAATAWGTVWLSQERGAPTVSFIRYLSPTVMMQALSGFVMIRGLAATVMPASWAPLVRQIGGLTLGTYVMHIMILEFVQSLGLSIYAFWIWLSAPVTTLVVFAVSAFITQVLRSSRMTRSLVS